MSCTDKIDTLFSDEPSKWQKLHRHSMKPVADGETHKVAGLPNYFNRVRRLDSPRDRLAASLFLEEPLHPLEGWRTLEDMISLCRENPQWHTGLARGQTRGADPYQAVREMSSSSPFFHRARDRLTIALLQHKRAQKVEPYLLLL
jgi:hypothetical protein